MSGKKRLSASVDAELIVAAERATARGEAATVSSWVNDALRLKVAHDQRLRALAAFIADYEAEHGEITTAETERAVRRAQSNALAVRGTRASESRRRPLR